jgi:hypothetical protein
MPTITKSYNVTLRDGKWVFTGKITFFGNRECGYTHFDLIADDGERGNGNDHLNFFCDDWTRMGDTHVVVWRNNNPDWPGESNYLYCQFDTHNNHGSNGVFSLQLS